MTTIRLAVVRILVVSLLLTLGARLYYLQVLDQDRLVQTANAQHIREVILAAPRGRWSMTVAAPWSPTAARWSSR